MCLQCWQGATPMRHVSCVRCRHRHEHPWFALQEGVGGMHLGIYTNSEPMVRMPNITLRKHSGLLSVLKGGGQLPFAFEGHLSVARWWFLCSRIECPVLDAAS